MSEIAENIGPRLADLLAEACLESLDARTLQQFALFYDLLIRWNARTNLTAIRDQDGILRLHFVESIACAQSIPAADSLLDLGSGGGIPGIPVALCRPEIAVTLAESQGKKAAFLREAVRTLQLAAEVHSGRAEELLAPKYARTFDCVTLRAVDRMAEAVGVAAKLVSIGGWLIPITSHAEVELIQAAAGPGFHWANPQSLPGSGLRVLLRGQRSSA